MPGHRRHGLQIGGPLEQAKNFLRKARSALAFSEVRG